MESNKLHELERSIRALERKLTILMDCLEDQGYYTTLKSREEMNERELMLEAMQFDWQQ